MPTILGPITTMNPVSRFEQMAVAVEAIIDNAVHPSGTKLLRGVLLAKIVSGNGTAGNYRAYAEGTVKTSGAFSTAAATFTLDPATAGGLIGNFQVGDVIEGTDGTALGTILTYNPVTGVGTLTGNSTSNYTAGNTVRITEASVSIASKNGRILKDEVLMESNNEPANGWIEGFFIQSRTTITAAALTKMSGKAVTTGEIRLV